MTRPIMVKKLLVQKCTFSLKAYRSMVRHRRPASYTLCLDKRDQNAFCSVFYKTRAIPMKFVT